MIKILCENKFVNVPRSQGAGGSVVG
jgi:hypothetical protein